MTFVASATASSSRSNDDVMSRVAFSSLLDLSSQVSSANVMVVLGRDTR